MMGAAEGKLHKGQYPFIYVNSKGERTNA